MVYVMVFGNCISCGVFMGFNPAKVPSLRINDVREPLCLECFNKWNQIHRISKGLEPEPLSPNAYMPQSEIEG